MTGLVGQMPAFNSMLALCRVSGAEAVPMLACQHLAMQLLCYEACSRSSGKACTLASKELLWQMKLALQV